MPPAGDCHLGAHTIYHRKIVGRECHAAVEVEPVRRVPCECTAHDYECDACFVTLCLIDRASLCSHAMILIISVGTGGRRVFIGRLC